MKTCPQCNASLNDDAPEGLCPRCLAAAAFQTAETRITGTPPGTPAELPDIGDAADVGARLPQYEIMELLGQGGMGVVYKARQKQLERIVALKILPPADALSPDFVERFRREAQSLAKLNHPNIVAIHDFGESGGLYYFAMEFVDGVNLREMIRTGKMKPEGALSVVPKICDALQFAHEEGVVHRDVKPENILIDKRGRVKIADFGLAKLLRREQSDHTLTMTGMTLGTPRYMAPEQLDKPETVDHRADIYSLGVVFYEMLTGEVPMGRFAPPSEKVRIDVRLDEIVLHALERDADRRYQHASQVRDDVEKVTSKPQVAPPPASAPQEDWTAHDARQFAMLTWAGLYAMAMLGICIALYGVVETVRSDLVERMAGGAPAVPWVRGLVFSVTLANVAFGMALMIIGRNRQRERSVRMGAINLVCAGSLLTIACGNWFDVPIWLGSLYMTAAFIGWMIFRRPDIKTAFARLPPRGSSPAPQQAAADSIEPRLSRCALFGAIWAPFALCGLAVTVFMFPPREGAFAEWIQGHPLGFTVSVGALTLIGVSAILGATILGGIAVAQIKRSGGKLYGLRLAAADALFFPLLAVGALAFYLTNLIAFTIAFNLRTPVTPSPDAPPERGLAVIDFAVIDSLVALTVMFFAGRAAWRSISGYKKPDTVPSVTAPAVWMLIGAVASIIMVLFLMSETHPNYVKGQFSAAGMVIRYAVLCAFAVTAVMTIRGALKMLGKEDYAASRQAAICSIFSIVGIITLPAGIWALVRLNRPEVKALFPEVPTTGTKGPRHLLSGFLALLMCAGFFFGFSFQAKTVATAPITTKLVTIGAVDPIYVSESGPSGFVTNLNFFSWSFFAVVVAGVALSALWRVHREDQGKVARDAAWWRRWWKQVGVWGGLLLIVCIVRTVKDPAKVLQLPNERTVSAKFLGEQTPAAIPPLGTITNGIGAEFTVPAGQVAIFEIVTRKDNATAPVPPHCAYVLAGESAITGTFRWSREPEQPATGLRRWRIELFSGAGNGATGGIALAEELDQSVSATGLTLGVLAPNEETLHGDGLVALRVTTVAHNLKTGGSGVASTEWKAADQENK